MANRPDTRFRQWMTHPRSVHAAVAVGALLTLLGLGNGLVLDDYFHQMALEQGHGYMGRPLAFWDLFNFFPDEPGLRAIGHEKGFWPWWSGDISIGFFRPVSSLTHALDYVLWPDAPWLMHLHSSLWYAALIAAVALVYRRLIGSGLALGLGTLLFALAGGHGIAVGWLATRNMLIAATFALVALYAHDRHRRDGWKPGAWFSPALLLVALCSAEFAIGILGYFAAYGLFVEPQRGWRRRLLSLAPHGAVLVAWQVAYKWMGYGARGTGLYLHPLDDLSAFAQAVVARWPVLILSQLTLPLTDGWAVVPFKAELFAGVVAGVLACALGWFLFAPLIRTDARARMFAVGGLIAAVPCCATLPHSRLLLMVGVGAFGLLALLVESAADEPLSRARAWVVRILLFRHVVLGSGLLVMGVLSPLTFAEVFGRAEQTLFPTGVDAAAPVVIVNAPHAFFGNFAAAPRMARGESVPKNLQLLGTTIDAVTVTRVDARTLRLETPDGYFAARPHHITYDPTKRIGPGFSADFGDATAEVIESTPDGRPAVIRYRFAADPSADRRWVTWRGSGFVPFDVPAVGSSVELPATELKQIFLAGK